MASMADCKAAELFLVLQKSVCVILSVETNPCFLGKLSIPLSCCLSLQGPFYSSGSPAPANIINNNNNSALPLLFSSRFERERNSSTP